MATGDNPRDVLLAEIRRMLVLLDASENWHRPVAKHGSGPSFLDEFSALQDEVREAPDFARLSALALVAPFAIVVERGQGSSRYARAALSGLVALFSRGVVRVETPHAVEAIDYVVDAVSRCRFEATVAEEDDEALAAVAEVLATCLACPCGAALGDDQAWAILQTCLRVHFEADSARLRQAAAHHAHAAVNALATRVTTAAAAAAGSATAPPPPGHAALTRLVAFLATAAASAPCPSDDGPEPDGVASGRPHRAAPHPVSPPRGHGRGHEAAERVASWATPRSPRKGSAASSAISLAVLRPIEDGSDGDDGRGDDGGPGPRHSSSLRDDPLARRTAGRHALQALQQHTGWRPDLHELALSLLTDVVRIAAASAAAQGSSVFHPLASDVFYAVVRTAHSPDVSPRALAAALSLGVELVRGFGDAFPDLVDTMLRRIILRPLRHPAIGAGALPGPACFADVFDATPVPAHTAFAALAVLPTPPPRPMCTPAARRHGVPTLLTHEGSIAALHAATDLLSDPATAQRLFVQMDMHDVRSPLVAEIAAALAIAAAPASARKDAARTALQSSGASTETPDDAIAVEGVPDAARFLLAAGDGKAAGSVPGEGGAFPAAHATLALRALGALVRSLSRPVDIGTTVFSDMPSSGTNFRGHVRARRISRLALAKAVASFNARPRRGASGMLSASAASPALAGAVSDPASRMAHLLRSGMWRLSKRSAGEFLGADGDFESSVRERFVESFHVAGASLVDVLRAVLETVRLPGEAQVIDRFVEAVAGAVFESCADAPSFENRDVAYLLAFSTIMLNTDLHNPSMDPERRMTVDQFVKYNTLYGADINQTIPLPASLLHAVFSAIAQREIRTSSDACGPVVECDSAPDGGASALRAWAESANAVDRNARGQSVLTGPAGGIVWADPAACVTQEEWDAVVERSSANAIRDSETAPRHEAQLLLDQAVRETALACIAPFALVAGVAALSATDSGEAARRSEASPPNATFKAAASTTAEARRARGVALLDALCDSASTSAQHTTHLLDTAASALCIVAGVTSPSARPPPAVPRASCAVSARAERALAQRLVNIAAAPAQVTSLCALLSLPRRSRPASPPNGPNQLDRGLSPNAWASTIAALWLAHDARLLPVSFGQSSAHDVLTTEERDRWMRTLLGALRASADAAQPTAAVSAAAAAAGKSRVGALVSWFLGGTDEHANESSKSSPHNEHTHTEATGSAAALAVQDATSESTSSRSSSEDEYEDAAATGAELRTPPPAKRTEARAASSVSFRTSGEARSRGGSHAPDNALAAQPKSCSWQSANEWRGPATQHALPVQAALAHIHTAALGFKRPRRLVRELDHDQAPSPPSMSAESLSVVSEAGLIPPQITSSATSETRLKAEQSSHRMQTHRRRRRTQRWEGGCVADDASELFPSSASRSLTGVAVNQSATAVRVVSRQFGASEAAAVRRTASRIAAAVRGPDGECELATSLARAPASEASGVVFGLLRVVADSLPGLDEAELDWPSGLAAELQDGRAKSVAEAVSRGVDSLPCSSRHVLLAIRLLGTIFHRFTRPRLHALWPHLHALVELVLFCRAPPSLAIDGIVSLVLSLACTASEYDFASSRLVANTVDVLFSVKFVAQTGTYTRSETHLQLTGWAGHAASAAIRCIWQSSQTSGQSQHVPSKSSTGPVALALIRAASTGAATPAVSAARHALLPLAKHCAALSTSKHQTGGGAAAPSPEFVLEMIGTAVFVATACRPSMQSGPTALDSVHQHQESDADWKTRATAVDILGQIATSFVESSRRVVVRVRAAARAGLLQVIQLAAKGEPEAPTAGLGPARVALVLRAAMVLETVLLPRSGRTRGERCIGGLGPRASERMALQIAAAVTKVRARTKKTSHTGAQSSDERAQQGSDSGDEHDGIDVLDAVAGWPRLGRRRDGPAVAAVLLPSVRLLVGAEVDEPAEVLLCRAARVIACRTAARAVAWHVGARADGSQDASASPSSTDEGDEGGSDTPQDDERDEDSDDGGWQALVVQLSRCGDTELTVGAFPDDLLQSACAELSREVVSVMAAAGKIGAAASTSAGHSRGQVPAKKTRGRHQSPHTAPSVSDAEMPSEVRDKVFIVPNTGPTVGAHDSEPESVSASLSASEPEPASESVPPEVQVSVSTSLHARTETSTPSSQPPVSAPSPVPAPASPAPAPASSPPPTPAHFARVESSPEASARDHREPVAPNLAVPAAATVTPFTANDKTQATLFDDSEAKLAHGKSGTSSDEEALPGPQHEPVSRCKSPALAAAQSESELSEPSEPDLVGPLAGHERFASLTDTALAECVRGCLREDGADDPCSAPGRDLAACRLEQLRRLYVRKPLRELFRAWAEDRLAPRVHLRSIPHLALSEQPWEAAEQDVWTVLASAPVDPESRWSRAMKGSTGRELLATLGPTLSLRDIEKAVVALVLLPSVEHGVLWAVMQSGLESVPNPFASATA